MATVHLRVSVRMQMLDDDVVRPDTTFSCGWSVPRFGHTSGTNCYVTLYQSVTSSRFSGIFVRQLTLRDRRIYTVIGFTITVYLREQKKI